MRDINKFWPDVRFFGIVRDRQKEQEMTLPRAVSGLLAIWIGIVGGGLSAQETPVAKPRPVPFKDFTFKRIKPGDNTGGKRITIQITPETVPEAEAETVAPAPGSTLTDEKAQKAELAWFWRDVPTDLKAPVHDRVQKALAIAARPPDGQTIPVPRLNDLQSVVSAYGRDILLATIGTHVSPALVLAVISVESGGAVSAVSSKGALGLMQLVPDTAARFGVDPLVASENIEGGVAYLDWLLQQFDGDPVLALAGYNAGENAVRKFGGVPPFTETRDYVPRVLAAWHVARGLCQTPPELTSDGCVFVSN